MKKSVFIISLVFAFRALAVEEQSESRFHLLTSKCEPETASVLETTPQSPPLDVDDPGTPGCNRWEINFLTTGDLAKSQNVWELPLLDINYGIGDNIQLKYEVPLVQTQSQGSTKSTVGNSRAGVKYMFFEDEQSNVQIAFYPQLDFATPQAKNNTNDDPEHKGTITELPILVSKKLAETPQGDIMLTGNLGFNFSSRPDTANSVLAAVGIGMPLMARVAFMGELSSEQATARNSENIREDLTKANVGVIGNLSKAVFLYTSVGQSLASSDGLNHNYVVAGFRILTDGAKE